MSSMDNRPRTPAYLRIYDGIRDLISDLELKPGQALSEKELSEKFGTSRQPVREAFIRLSQEGLVEIRPQIGTYVARLDTDQIQDAVFARVALECAAVQEAVGRITERQLAELRENLAAHGEAARSGDDRAVYREDEAFHIRLIEFSGHAGIWPMIRQARTHMLRLRNLSARTLKTASEAVRDHTRVVDAIANGDAERAAQSLKSHIEQNVDYMGRLRDEYPDYFGTGSH